MKLKNVKKSYSKAHKNIEVLKNINVSFEKGKLYLIKGKSGVGKTTLINILGLIDKFDSGEYDLDGILIAALNESELSNIRKKKIGMIFQNYYLNPRLTAKENIQIATFLNDLSEEENELNMTKFFKELELENRINHYPKELSGGEQARFAIIRALINNPTYVLADEPTGNLDTDNSIKIYDILKNLTKDNKCVIVVSHEELPEKYADTIYELNNGELMKQK